MAIALIQGGLATGCRHVCSSRPTTVAAATHCARPSSGSPHQDVSRSAPVVRDGGQPPANLCRIGSTSTARSWRRSWRSSAPSCLMSRTDAASSSRMSDSLCMTSQLRSGDPAVPFERAAGDVVGSRPDPTSTIHRRRDGAGERRRQSRREPVRGHDPRRRPVDDYARAARQSPRRHSADQLLSSRICRRSGGRVQTPEMNPEGRWNPAPTRLVGPALAQ